MQKKKNVSSLFMKVIDILWVLCSGKIQLKHLIQITPCSSSENFPLLTIHSASLLRDSLVEYMKSISDKTVCSKIIPALAIIFAIFFCLTDNFCFYEISASIRAKNLGILKFPIV